jgi:filamentous hemagglutinin
MPRNHEFAGGTYPVERLSPELREKYPNSVKVSEKGLVEFTPYAIAEVDIKYTGNRNKDYKLANEAAGIKVKPGDYSWHHHENGRTMQLVPRDLHQAVRHTGGCATSGLDYNGRR